MADPCRVTLIAHSFTDPSGQIRNLYVEIDVPDGNYQTVITKVRNEGGVFVPDEISGGRFFLPWPMAAVLIE